MVVWSNSRVCLCVLCDLVVSRAPADKSGGTFRNRLSYLRAWIDCRSARMASGVSLCGPPFPQP